MIKKYQVIVICLLKPRRLYKLLMHEVHYCTQRAQKNIEMFAKMRVIVIEKWSVLV